VVVVPGYAGSMIARLAPIVLLLGCPGPPPTNPPPEDSDAPATTGTVSFTLSIDETHATLPDEGVSFQVTAVPEGSLDAVALLEVAPDAGGSFELEPGDYHLDAFYSWVDPSAGLRGELDTGGYYQSQCWGRQATELAAGDDESVVIQVECDAISLD
jgi:hypothetical protein